MCADAVPGPGAVSAGLAQGLVEARVQRLFGVPGGGPNLDIISAAARFGIGFVLCHGETSACIMAGAFGLLTGTTGVAVVTRGPGLTSAANGLAQATLDRAPLLLLSDRVPADQREYIGHQRLDQPAVAAPLTRWHGTLGYRDPAATARASVALAGGPPPGAVQLDYDPGVPGDLPPRPCETTPLDEAALRTATERARGRRRPVVLLGTGAIRHAAWLRTVLTDVPVLTTYQALGVIDSDARQAAGLFTNAALERPLLEQADLVIGLGIDSVEPLPGRWSYDAPVLLLSDTEVDGAYFGAGGAELHVVLGSPRATLPAVLSATEPVWPADAGRRHRETVLAALTEGPRSSGLHPVDLVREVRRAAGDGVGVTVDAGAHMLAVMPLWTASRPYQVLISNGLATMGYALPAAIGAALARPGERVFCLVGDGGLGMTLAELETVARLRLPITVVVFNDAALSLIELKQRSGERDAGSVRYQPIDFASVAAAMNVPASVADDLASVRAALAAAESQPGPYLVDARIDPAGYRQVLAVSRG